MLKRYIMVCINLLMNVWLHAWETKKFYKGWSFACDYDFLMFLHSASRFAPQSISWTRDKSGLRTFAQSVPQPGWCYRKSLPSHLDNKKVRTFWASATVQTMLCPISPGLGLTGLAATGKASRAASKQFTLRSIFYRHSIYSTVVYDCV